MAQHQPRRGAREGDGLTDLPSPARRRAPRLDPATRRGLIVDAAERLLAEHDPLLLTFEEVAEAAGVSRALVHSYVGDRRGLVDAVQARIAARLDTWVGHGLDRATTRDARVAAVVHAVWSFVDTERDAWGVLAATGGFDHRAMHGVRARWAAAWSVDDDPADLAAQAAVGALLGGAGIWVTQGIEPTEIIGLMTRLVGPARPET